MDLSLFKVNVLVRLISARYFKLMTKSWNSVRIFLSSFLLKILRETSLEITKTLMSALFSAYFFVFKLQQSIHYWKVNFILIQLCKKNCTLKSLFLEIFRVDWHYFHENIYNVWLWTYAHCMMLHDKIIIISQKMVNQNLVSF